MYQRIVRLGGPIDDDMANLIVAQLLYLDSTGKQDITMYVNSPGGSVTAGEPSMRISIALTALAALAWLDNKLELHQVAACRYGSLRHHAAHPARREHSVCRFGCIYGGIRSCLGPTSMLSPFLLSFLLVFLNFQQPSEL